MKKRLLLALALITATLGVLYSQGLTPHALFGKLEGKAHAMRATDHSADAQTKANDAAKALAPAVTVARVKPAKFIEHVLVTGSLVAREKILVTPEIEGLSVLSFKAEEGDYVKKGQVLARLEQTTLTSDLDQNTAAIARAQAAIAQSQSLIAEAEAQLKEATASLKRAKPLKKSGYLSGSTYDTRESATNSASARLTSARSGYTLAQAEKAQLEAKRRELEWRLSKAEIKAPAAGLIAKRNLRIGGVATSTGEPMFEIIAGSEIELDAEIDDQQLVKVAISQPATIDIAGLPNVHGTVRLVSPEVDKATRLGHVRILLGADRALKIGAYGRGTIETARASGLAVPASALLYKHDGASVFRVKNNQVHTVLVTVGLRSNGVVEITSGLSEGDLVIAKSGTFLREGDYVRPIEPGATLSEVDQ